MKKKQPWHEQASVWRKAAPVLFSSGRWQDAAGEIEQIITLLHINRNDYILDLCCGEGRHCLELARKGYRVMGVDKSSLYLKRAATKSGKEKLPANFIQDDMRLFRQDSTFEVILNLFTSFGYFEDPRDEEQVIMNVHASLKPGGVFLLHLIGKETMALNLIERDWYEEDGMYVLEERRPAKDWTWLDNRWIIFKDNKRSEVNLSLRLYSAAELRSLLTACGFKEITLYGDLEGNPYDQYASRLVITGRK